MESLTASYLLSLFSLITIADLSLSPNFRMEGEKLLPIVLRKPLHYVWHRSENKHSTSLPPLLPPLTPETLFILFMCWPARLLLVKLFVVCCLSWQSLRTAKHRTCAWSDLHCSHSCISLHQTVNQQSIWHAEGGGGGREEEEGSALQCVYSEARSWLRDGVTFLPRLRGGTGCYFHSVSRWHHPSCRCSNETFTHTHTEIWREAIVTVLSASRRSQWFKFHSHKTPQETKMKADLCSILLVIAAVVASQIIS